MLVECEAELWGFQGSMMWVMHERIDNEGNGKNVLASIVIMNDILRTCKKCFG